MPLCSKVGMNINSSNGREYWLQAQFLPAAQNNLAPLASPGEKWRDDVRGKNHGKKCFEEENKMRKEEFVALGISEELAGKAAKASEEEMKGYVTKARFNEVNTAKNNAEKLYGDTKSELDKLKESAGDNETLKSQIESLKKDLQTKESTHKAEIADMKMTNAIQAAIGHMAQDVGLVAGLLDKSKLSLSDDGKLTGLEDQIKGLKESKPFLFKEGETYPNVHDGGEPGGQGGKGDTRSSFASWMEDVMGGN